MGVTVETVYRITVGDDWLIATPDEAQEVIDALTLALSGEPDDAVGSTSVDVDDEETEYNNASFADIWKQRTP